MSDVHDSSAMPAKPTLYAGADIRRVWYLSEQHRNWCKYFSNRAGTNRVEKHCEMITTRGDRSCSVGALSSICWLAPPSSLQLARSPPRKSKSPPRNTNTRVDITSLEPS